MLIDEYLPSYDASEKHSETVEASAERIYTALRTADLAACKTVRLLLTLRALPGALLAGSKGWSILRARMTASIRLQAFEEQGFTVLDEDPPRELLIGLTGRFWTLRGGLQRLTRRALWRASHQALPALRGISGSSLSTAGGTCL